MKENTKSKRGGKREIKPIKDLRPEVALFRCIIHFSIGPTALARQLDVVPQLIINAFTRTTLPLKYVFKAADILDVDIYALNYTGVTKMLGKGPKWRQLVMDIDFIPLKTRKEILNLGEPII